MRKIAIINQKGGSGKTTTSVNLSAALAHLGKKVLLIDLDPQASATSWLGAPTTEKDLVKVILENVNINNIIKDSYHENIKLVASSSWLITLEKQLFNEVGAETILKQRLEVLDYNKWDYVIIDCPPTLGLITINILNACSEVIVPVESRVMALAGLVQLMQTIDVVKSRLNSNLKIAGVVACRVDLRTKHSKEVLDELKNKFSRLVYNTIIRENIRLSEAPSFCKTILEYDHLSNGAKDYVELAKEVINQENILFTSQNNKNSNLNISI
ncbi:ParA family protein [Candidatus Babela massiliensis]|uniref:ATPase involved in chromosome partitioning ParA family n=1 Tax=Candidatus Babela massiliensis TaxID=673862 RepID=V6DJI8_9BACT|nr:ParA family protein [Candidatus Babela massiliensis]CDK30681.1 ATPase involved in chromosome partitioning ParA family [Candidatus Babela massiliensis]